MAKKKKDKTDEPTKTKPKRSSRKAAPRNAATIDGTAAVVIGIAGPARTPTLGERKLTTRNSPTLSEDDIARRAYFIAERRRRLNASGDELGDWVEAERQLRKEAAGN